MSDKDRRKKGGHDKNKENQDAREAFKERHTVENARLTSTDHGDLVYEQGPSASDTGVGKKRTKAT